MNEREFLLWFIQYCALAANYKPYELVDDFLANVHVKYEQVQFLEKKSVTVQGARELAKIKMLDFLRFAGIEAEPELVKTKLDIYLSNGGRKDGI